MNINEISEKLAEDFKTIDAQSRNVLKILICGSHLGDDKKHIADFRDRVRDELKVPGAFLMEDIEVEGTPELHQKFDLIWNLMLKGDNVPLCIVFAGETGDKSVGLNVEIGDIAKDSEKKPHTSIIRLKGVKLATHAEEFPCYTVEDPEDFKRVGISIIQAKIEEIKSFLLYRSRKGGKNERK